MGTIGTAVISGLAAGWLFDLTTLEGLLLGSILASTDGAATFAVLRGSTLERRLARTLEAESGLNDPVAVLLVLGFIEWIQEPGYGLADMAVLFVAELGIGAAVGAGGRLAVGRGVPARAAGLRRPVPGRVAGLRPRSPSGAPTRCTARASSRSTSPGSRWARRGSRPS